jgi:hypothetical protein
MAHKQTKAKLQASAAERIKIYINTTEKRLESQIDDLRKKNETLMQEKIILNGKIAVL